jgi:PAS domain S-box-containing protein
MKAPEDSVESARLASLRRYAVLDTPPEQALDDVAQFAAMICQVPMALVSLVGEDRQWFNARVGVNAPQTPRDVVFSAHTIRHTQDAFVVPDVAADPRFASGLLASSGPKIGFYAGVPLVAPGGHAIGALCVMDHGPRNLTPEQLAALWALSRATVVQLELRRRTADLAAAVEEGQRLVQLAEKSRLALLAVLEDEKHMGLSLRASEERFRQLAENIDEVFWLLDPKAGKMLYASPAFEKIWGRTCASLVESTQNWTQALYPEDRDRVVAAAAKQAAGNYDITYRIIRPDGDVRWIHDRAFPVKNAADEVYRIAGVAQDITEQKLLEAQFFRAQRLESIGTLASGIAHDLNNILAPILMAVPIIRLSKSPEASAKMLAMVESSAQRAAKLVRQLLSFGRGAEGEKQRLRIAPLIKEIATMVEQTFPKDIALTTEVASATAEFLGDATQIHQILLNLCVNARDAMPKGGQLTVSASNVHLSPVAAGEIPGATPGDFVVISVTDTGTGMTAEVLDKIFDPFFTTKEVGKGTGLGLATVQGLVKSRGGFLTVKSQPGRGSSFQVHLPVVVEAPVAVTAGELTGPVAGRGETVLVVDDEENIRDAVRGILMQFGYTVILAEDGVDGVARFAAAQSEIRLVICDLDMPNMNGLTMIRVLRQLSPTLKVIISSGVMSGKDPGSRSEEIAELGVSATLDKPYPADELLRVVQAALTRPD